MDFKKIDAPVSTVTRNIVEIAEKTGNVYEAVVIIAKFADQVNADLRKELYEKLEEFATYTDTLEEVHENREQIEVSRYYERLPKPSLIALEEFLSDNIYCAREIETEGIEEVI
ncbi:MAG: RNA polymerase Rpb6 [Bacteroidales bacterium]|jgi:DNA-directed RNA polymerase subunit K/omega|nr:DNA-directed RNA polymerase subunit omega [Bacteroidales bacterium]MCK9498570.1 DNA-directed RNA polymerase subunit omega [Bacteroidales bacterium]MDY0314466.1 DNA-directed RNA polymerase subunit omega [Bacteroidales bacterium]NLB87200.1 RNA polymerase Rpb6 [Bacteroidales bacterium]